jgi:hypothetical protein
MIVSLQHFSLLPVALKETLLRGRWLKSHADTATTKANLEAATARSLAADLAYSEGLQRAEEAAIAACEEQLYEPSEELPEVLHQARTIAAHSSSVRLKELIELLEKKHRPQ